MGDALAVDHAGTADAERQGNGGPGSCGYGGSSGKDDADDIVGPGVRGYDQFLDRLDFTSRAEDDGEHFRAADIDTDRRPQRHSSPAQVWPPKQCNATAVAAATLSESTPPAIAIRTDRHILSTDALEAIALRADDQGDAGTLELGRDHFDPLGLG